MLLTLPVSVVAFLGSTSLSLTSLGGSREQVRQGKRECEVRGSPDPMTLFCVVPGSEEKSDRKRPRFLTYGLKFAFHFLFGKSFIEI